MAARSDEEKWLDALYGPANGAPAYAGTAVPAIRKLPYYKEPDGVVLSYSKLGTLHTCPREFYLGEMQGLKAFMPSAHTAYGHAVGAGVQEYLVARTKGHEPEAALAIAIVAAMAAWDMPSLWEQDKRGIKAIERAMLAVERFALGLGEDLLLQYTVPQFRDRYAVELFFVLRLTERYTYQGHIDLVLQDRETGELVVLEIKTGSGAFDVADWANSPQALGYNCVLQAYGTMSQAQTAYHVLYLHYDAAGLDWTLQPFSKPAAVRAEWLTTLLLDVQTIEMYEQTEVFPKRGSQCKRFGRTCSFFGTCDLTQQVHAAPVEGAYESISADEVDIWVTADAVLQHFAGDSIHG